MKKLIFLTFLSSSLCKYLSPPPIPLQSSDLKKSTFISKINFWKYWQFFFVFVIFVTFKGLAGLYCKSDTSLWTFCTKRINFHSLKFQWLNFWSKVFIPSVQTVWIFRQESLKFQCKKTKFSPKSWNFSTTKPNFQSKF